MYFLHVPILLPALVSLAERPLVTQGRVHCRAGDLFMVRVFGASLIYRLQCLHVSSLYYRLWRTLRSSSLSLPRLCLQRWHLCADGSSTTPGLLLLLLGWLLLRVHGLRGRLDEKEPPPPPLLQPAFRWAVEWGDPISVKQTLMCLFSCFYQSDPSHALTEGTLPSTISAVPW